jgi:hypothetical protein
MKMYMTCILLPGLWTCASLSASADVIFDNGVPDRLDAYFADSVWYQEVSDDFAVVDGANVLTGVQWWGIYFSNTAVLDAFTIRIFEDNGNSPALTPLYEFTGLNGGRTLTGDLILGTYTIYAYSANIAPTTLAPDTRYWLAILNNTTSSPYDSWAWTTAAQAGNVWYRQDPAGTWNPAAGELAFQLTSVVPEPATAALLALGIAGLAIRMRRSCS